MLIFILLLIASFLIYGIGEALDNDKLNKEISDEIKSFFRKKKYCKNCKFWGWKNEVIEHDLCEKHLKNPSYPYCQSKEDILKSYGKNHDPHILCKEMRDNGYKDFYERCENKTYTCSACGLEFCSVNFAGQDCMAKGMATNHTLPKDINE